MTPLAGQASKRFQIPSNPMTLCMLMMATMTAVKPQQKALLHNLASCDDIRHQGVIESAAPCRCLLACLLACLLPLLMHRKQQYLRATVP